MASEHPKMSDLSPEADLLVAALQPLPMAVLITDVHGIVRSVNAALTSLTGFTAEEAVGQPVTLLSFGTGERDFYGIIREGVRSREPWRGELKYRRKDGAPFTAEQTVTSIECPNGEKLVLITIQGIAGPRQMEVDLPSTPGRPDTEKRTTGGAWPAGSIRVRA